MIREQGPAPLPGQPDSPNFLTFKNAAKDLPAFPAVAGEVMKLVDDDDSSASDLQRVIGRDPALAARVLKIANSAFYGASTEISTLSHAITRLGWKPLQSIVIAASSRSIFSNKSFKDMLLWEHALGVANVSRALAGKCRYRDVESAFVAGLLHDIGKPILDSNLGDLYSQVIQDVYNEGVTFLQAERRILGFDHTEVGVLVLKKWNLPQVLQEAVKFHHDPGRAEISPHLCAIVSFANSLCVKMGLGPERLPDLDLNSLETARLLKLDSDTVSEYLEEAREWTGSELVH